MSVCILHIETATPICSVALAMDGKPIASAETEGHNLHASQLNQSIAAVLEKTGIGMDGLHAVAVGKGPGSYTGLRIGVSTAKGLCYALDVPLISVNTLDGMFRGFLHAAGRTEYDVFFPMIDARRMEVYTAAYGPQGDKLEDAQALIVDESSFQRYRENRIVLFGSGAGKLAGTFGDPGRIAVVLGFKNSARYLCAPAFRKYEDRTFEDVVRFEPFYLKDFMPTTAKSVLQAK